MGTIEQQQRLQALFERAALRREKRAERNREGTLRAYDLGPAVRAQAMVSRLGRRQYRQLELWPVAA